MNTFTIAIAGTTTRTVQCAEALLASNAFVIPWVLTPEPKPIGRKKVITSNPVETFALSHHIPVINLTDTISPSVQTEITAQPPIDFLLVVDFGYFVPNWLLKLPQIAPLNIHPSALPKWRGSSPGQFALLYGEKSSAVTLIKMNARLDQGPIIASLPFEVNPSWTSEDYYAFSFKKMAEQLPRLLTTYVDTHEETVQPLVSPTPTAVRIHKQDAYIPWELLKKSQHIPDFVPSEQENTALTPLLVGAMTAHSYFAQLVVAAVHALSPWPKVWTFIETAQGKKRMQIHAATTQKTAEGSTLQLETVQIEGQSSALFNQVKNSILE